MRKIMKLKELLLPMEQQIFIDEYLEKEPVVITRNQPDYFEPLLTLDGIGQLLSDSQWNDRFNIFLVDTATNVSSHEYATIQHLHNADVKTAISKNKILKKFHHEKSSIIIPDILHALPVINEMAGDINDQLKCQSEATIAITPANAGYSSVSSDDTDTVIVVIFGKCRLNIYKRSADRINDSTDTSALEKYTAMDVAQGDTAYIPKGYMYVLETSGSACVNIRIDLTAVTWLKIITDHVVKLAKTDLYFRKGFASYNEESVAKQERCMSYLSDQLLSSLTLDGLKTLAARYASASAMDNSLKALSISDLIHEITGSQS